MRINDTQSFLLNVPVGKSISDSMRSVTHLELAGLMVATDSDIIGTGYTITVGHGGSVIKEAIDTLFADDLIGKDPFDVREIWQELYFGKAHWIGRAGATAMAQSAIDIALWDIIARSAGRPLWQVLGGGASGDVPIYNTHAGWLNFSIGQLVREANDLIDQGYSALKVKVGLDDLREDYRRVKAVRDAVGADVLLMVDANQKWDLLRASSAVRMLADLDVTWVEEPVHPDDVRSHRILRESSTVPVALGEHLYSTYAFRDYIERAAVDVVQVDVCRIGGITPWLEVAAIADAFNLKVCPHCGDLMQVHQHLVKAVTNSWMLEVIPLWDEGPFVEQVQLREGICETPTAPGASTEIKPAALERFRVA